MRDFCISFLVVIAIFAVANATPYTDCGSSLGSVKSLEVSGCPEVDDEKCILHRNTNATFKLTFQLKKDVQTVKGIVHGVVLDVPVPFKLPNPDGCVNSGLTCPLKAGASYTYETSLPVLKKYPRLSVDVKWELQNEEDKDIVCVIIPAKIQ